jgi:hypothetical protein
MWIVEITKISMLHVLLISLISLCFPLSMNLFIKIARMTSVHEPRVVFLVFCCMMQFHTCAHAWYKPASTLESTNQIQPLTSFHSKVFWRSSPWGSWLKYVLNIPLLILMGNLKWGSLSHENRGGVSTRKVRYTYLRRKLKYCLFPLSDSTIWPMGR